MDLDKTPSSNAQIPRLHWYEPNVRAMLASYITGVGPQDVQEILASLDLPRTRHWRRGYNRLTTRLSRHIREANVESMKQAMVCEIEATIRGESKLTTEKEKDEEVKLWFRIPTHLRPKIGISISYDMGWQKRTIHRMSSTYSSLSGHGFAIGLRTKKVVSMIVYSKICQTCQIAKASDKNIPTHDCPCNYEGSSKSMESDGALTMLKRCYKEHSVHFKHIVSDDDSTMRSLLKHANNGGDLPSCIL